MYNYFDRDVPIPFFFFVLEKTEFKCYCTKKQHSKGGKNEAVSGISIRTSSDPPPLCISASPGIRQSRPPGHGGWWHGVIRDPRPPSRSMESGGLGGCKGWSVPRWGAGDEGRRGRARAAAASGGGGSGGGRASRRRLGGGKSDSRAGRTGGSEGEWSMAVAEDSGGTAWASGSVLASQYQHIYTLLRCDRAW